MFQLSGLTLDYFVFIDIILLETSFIISYCNRFPTGGLVAGFGSLWLTLHHLLIMDFAELFFSLTALHPKYVIDHLPYSCFVNQWLFFGCCQND